MSWYPWGVDGRKLLIGGGGRGGVAWCSEVFCRGVICRGAQRGTAATGVLEKEDKILPIKKNLHISDKENPRMFCSN